MKLKTLKEKLLNNPEIKKEYETYDLAFEISQMLIEARIMKGVTQTKLAEMIQTKQSSIARAENGMNLPSLSFLDKIAKSLKTFLIIRFAFMEPKEVAVKNESKTISHDKQIKIEGEGSLYASSFGSSAQSETFVYAHVV